MRESLGQFASVSTPIYPKRVFCDVHDTLEDPVEGISSWNEPLLRLLKAMKDNGYEVTLFSGSPKRTGCVAEMCLSIFGVPDIFGPVRDKLDCKGERAQYVIDNDHDSHEIAARFQLGPLDEAIFILYGQLTGTPIYQSGPNP